MSRLATSPLFVLALILSGRVGSSPADEPPGHVAPRTAIVRALAFSPDGKILAAGSGSKDRPGGVTMWDVGTRKRLWRRDAASVPSLSFAPDGRSLFVAQVTPAALRLDAVNGQPIGEFGPHPANVRAVAHVPGTDLLATGSDGTIRLWDVKAGTVHKELAGHPKEVTSLVPSPDGRWLISTGADATRAWDVAAGRQLNDLIKQERGTVHYGIVFVAPNRVLMGSNWGGQAVRELPTGEEVLRFKAAGGYDGAASSLAARLVAYHGVGGTQVSIADLSFREPTPAEQARIAKLLSDFDDESYAIREAASAEMRQVRSVAEPALRRAMTAGPSAEVRMRAREVRKAILSEPLRGLVGPTGGVGPMTFSLDGKLLATGSEDGIVRLWDPATGREIVRFEN